MTWATINAGTHRLASGKQGTGGRATGDGSTLAVRGNRASRRETPYRVAGTTASDYSTRVAGNTSRVFRDER